ncbi:hypothetical protein CTAYLR_008979 [Chrysophaeum taylorii]|uniref:Fe2OG dioxygenase domain-containing protein n=1 Tax=Chrysophaeum taylorii TaxID=2483200 RepID=A0AAD7U9A2_9STRA|nr:hypothetical protein CTAYLR_008979 [Chrysophaeum taylorii]
MRGVGGKAAVAGLVREACCEWGFFYATGHGVDEGLMEEALARCRALFALPLAEKERLDASQSKSYRGYNSLASGKHNCKPGPQEIKESFTIGREGEGPMRGGNQWPPLGDEWRDVMKKYFAATVEAARLVARALALSLGIEETFFVEQMTDPSAGMVLLRYPSSPDETEGVGCGEHTDAGFVTMLLHDEVPGLEVKPRGSEEWVAVPPRKGAFLVNLGDMMARWSNDAYLSTPHRVNAVRASS